VLFLGFHWLLRGSLKLCLWLSVRHHEGLCLSRDRQHTGGEFGAGALAIQEGIQTVLCGGALFFSEETIVVSLGLGYFSVILIFVYS
jgi:hypothetical protein